MVRNLDLEELINFEKSRQVIKAKLDPDSLTNCFLGALARIIDDWSIQTCHPDPVTILRPWFTFQGEAEEVGDNLVVALFLAFFREALNGIENERHGELTKILRFQWMYDALTFCCLIVV